MVRAETLTGRVGLSFYCAKSLLVAFREEVFNEHRPLFGASLLFVHSAAAIRQLYGRPEQQKES
jgi:hypothetical protein